ncbi:MAG: hypothetical protein QXL94_00380 [Candidatus Parvarchaeum sp.]
MPEDARYYLNHYRPQIEEAIRKSFDSCLEYGYVIPVGEQPVMIEGLPTSLPIPDEVVYGAHMVFHTHPFYLCERNLGTAKFHRYISEHLLEMFSANDIQHFFQHNIKTELLAGYMVDHKVVIRGVNQLSFSEVRSYIRKITGTVDLISDYARGDITEDNLVLRDNTESFRSFIDTQTPILEIMDLNLIY